MKNKEYLDYHNVMLRKMADIVAKKNADYSGSEEDAFSNFKRVEELDIASVEQGFLTRMTDKLSRVNTFIKKGTLSVIDETVEDTLLDLANYAILMSGYIKSKKMEELGQSTEDGYIYFRYEVNFYKAPGKVIYKGTEIEIKDKSIEFISVKALSEKGVLELLKGTDTSLIKEIKGDLRYDF